MDRTTSSYEDPLSAPSSPAEKEYQEHLLRQHNRLTVIVVVVVLAIIAALYFFVKRRNGAPQHGLHAGIVDVGPEPPTYRPHPRCPGIAISALGISGLDVEEAYLLDSGVHRRAWAARRLASRLRDAAQAVRTPTPPMQKDLNSAIEMEAMETGRAEALRIRRKLQQMEQRSGKPQHYANA